MGTRFNGLAGALALAAGMISGSAAARPVCEPDSPPLVAAPVGAGSADSPGSRHVADPPQVPGVRVAIPFAPPLGQSLRYRSRRTSWEGNRPRYVDMSFSLHFERAGAGYRMVLAHMLSDAQRARTPAGVLVLAEPVAFLLDADGRVVAMEDEDAYWAALDQAVDALRPELRARDPQAEARLREMVRALRSLADADRLAVLSELAAPVLSAAGLDLVTGTPQRMTRPVQFILGRPVAELSLSVSRLGDGRARVEVEADVPAERLREVVAALVAAGVSGLEPYTVLSSSHEGSIEVSLETGLAHRATIRTGIEVEANGKCERLRQDHVVERIEDPAEAQR